MNSTDSVPIPGFTGSFDDAVRITWITTYLDVVGAALVVYDTIVTLEQEIRLVWLGHWGYPSAAYILARYGTLIMANLNLVAELDWQLNMEDCYSWNVFSVWNIPIILLLVEATLTMRVIALYGNKRWIKIGLWAWYLAAASSMLALNGLSLQGSFAVPSPAPPTLGCQIAGSFSQYWALWVPSLVLEFTLAIMTLGRALHHKSMWKEAPLFFVLVRDGFFYFFVVVVLMLLNLIVALTLNTIYIGWFPQISACLVSVIAARMFLNLRETVHPTGQAYTYEMPTIQDDTTYGYRNQPDSWVTTEASTSEPSSSEPYTPVGPSARGSSHNKSETSRTSS